METSVIVTKDPARRRKTLRNLLIGFIVLMVVLTFFSKTINNISLPKVSTSSPFSSALQKVVTGSGRFSAIKNVPVSVDESCEVGMIPVSAGDIVAQGDTLIVFDMDSLQTQLSAEQDSLTEMKNNRKKAALGYTAQDYTQMQVAVNEAKHALDAAQSNYDTVKTAFDAGTASQSDLDVAQQALTNARNDYNIKKNQLSHAKTLDSKQKKANNLDLANMDIQIAQQQSKFDGLETLIEKGGKVTSPISGIVQQINVQEGGMASPSQPVMTVTDVSQGLEFDVDVINDDADLIPLGSEVEITLQGSSNNSIVKTTLADKKESISQPGQMTMLCLDAAVSDISALNVQPNQAGDIRYTFQTQSYQTTIPNDAICEDSTSSFILVLDQKNTPLGQQYVLRRIDVTVIDSDSFRTAVSGALGPGAQVVTGSDKPVGDGDIVRLAS